RHQLRAVDNLDCTSWYFGRIGGGARTCRSGRPDLALRAERRPPPRPVYPVVLGDLLRVRALPGQAPASFRFEHNRRHPTNRGEHHLLRLASCLLRRPARPPVSLITLPARSGCPRSVAPGTPGPAG